MTGNEKTSTAMSASRSVILPLSNACNEWFHKKCERINAPVFKDEGKAKNELVETVKRFF